MVCSCASRLDVFICSFFNREMPLFQIIAYGYSYFPYLGDYVRFGRIMLRSAVLLLLLVLLLLHVFIYMVLNVCLRGTRG